MTVMGERLPEAWMVEWHRNRRVEFPIRRWLFLQLTLLYFGISAGTLIRLPDILDEPGWRYFGYLAIVLYVGTAGFVVWTFVTQRPYLVVDHTGIHSGRRFMAWTDIGSIGLLRGPVRQLPIHPKNVWAKDLVITRQHVNDLQSFRTWLDEVLEEQRRTESPRDDDASDWRRTH